MRTNSESEKNDALLDAVLQDENWQSADATFKAQVLGTFRARQRVRRLTRWAGSVAALAAVTAGVAYWLSQPAPAPRQLAAAPPAAPKQSDQPRELTDEQLVAAFPKGSCFIAEVDGKKQLVFFDPEMERAYVAHPVVRGN